MCFYKDKWPKEVRNEEDYDLYIDYFGATQHIVTLDKLKAFLIPFKYKSDVKDYWQAPHITYNLKTFDCEDMAIMVMDILKKRIGIDKVFFFLYGGYFMKEGIRIHSGHAICLFWYNEEWWEYTNKALRFAFKEGEWTFLNYGLRHYPEGLTWYERRDSSGKVIERRRAWIGLLK